MRSVASWVGTLLLGGARCQVLDALPHIDDRPATHRRLLPGDGGVLLEHEPALVPAVVEQADDLLDPRVSLRRAAGTARPASPATSDSSPARTRAARPASTSLRWTWTMRSPCSRTKSTGSVPPIRRWPVSRHQPTSLSASTRSTSSSRLDQRAHVRVQREREAVRGDEPSISARWRRARPTRRRRARCGGDQASSDHGRRDEHVGAGGGEDRARPVGARARAPSSAGSCSTSGTKPPTSRRPWRSSRSRSAARRRAAGSRSGRARWRAGRATPSRPGRARARAAAPAGDLADAPRDRGAGQTASSTAVRGAGLPAWSPDPATSRASIRAL